MSEHDNAVKACTEVEPLLKATRFDEAADLIRQAREQHGAGTVLRTLSYLADTENAGLLAYTLTVYLLTQQEEALWHRSAGRMLSNELCHLPNAYDCALHHACRAAELDPDEPQAWRLILWVTDSPDLSNRESSRHRRRHAAERLLALRPDDRKARAILKS